MTRSVSTATRADYGVDAPGVVLRFAVFGLAGVVLGCILLLLPLLPQWARGFGSMFLWPGATFLLTSGVMLWGSKVGKLRFARKVVDGLALKGDERVLDVGCGHGLMLITAAKRLNAGSAVGVDIWQKEDQAGNSPDATLANARAEGMEDRVELKDGDARQLPFDDNEFDVVLSSWVLHNIYDAEGRERAIREIARVLKPGGRAAIADIRHTKDYARIMHECAMQDVRLNAPSFIFVIPTRLLTATKPHA